MLTNGRHFNPPYTWLTTISTPVLTMSEVYRDDNSGAYVAPEYDSVINGLVN